MQGRATQPIHQHFLVSIVVSIPACHAGDRGSIPRRGGLAFFLVETTMLIKKEKILTAS